MHCPTCKAWTEVETTRKPTGERMVSARAHVPPGESMHSLRRIRVCANGHRFGTIETLEKLPDLIRRRNKQIVNAMKNGGSVADIARQFRVSRRTVERVTEHLRAGARRGNQYTRHEVPAMSDTRPFAMTRYVWVTRCALRFEEVLGLDPNDARAAACEVAAEQSELFGDSTITWAPPGLAADADMRTWPIDDEQSTA